MASKDKLLKRIQNNPKAVSFADLQKLLEYNGFVLDRVKGSHHTFYKGDITFTIPYRKPVKEIYVKIALKFIQGDNQ
ncbi:type II toxin-antitoxin system HicA family toxin [Helicobacter sp. 11S02596-1]|uniref:type II toxin-antitoxin system HicA family toxin n=1 Tax=Helicobacter sp. 11S02596-1 TaxID=1476194 RepID=UPI000BA62C5C|nr:type II toxin-antitoxin system HicA family toxin [Helicobacter sp. 11S02596-1]PAF43535.1 hypothetical protein BJI48_04570 [Helicobacter sp. 11S02596-1]